MIKAMIKSIVRRISVFSILLFAFQFSFALDQKNTSAGETFAAVSRLISEKTQIAGVDEKSEALSPKAMKTFEQLENDLEACQTTEERTPELVVVQKDGVEVKFKNFHLKISGPNCPMTMEAKMQMNPIVGDQFDGSFSVSIKFQKQSFIDKYKVKEIAINCALTGSIQKINNAIQMRVAIDMLSRGDSLDLGLFSQTMKMSTSVDVNMATFQFNMGLEQYGEIQYGTVKNTLSAKTSVVGFTQGSSIFKYNDQEVSESEYKQISESFILPMIVEDADPNAPDAQTISSCTFLVYEKSKMTEQKLKEQFLKPMSEIDKNGLVDQGSSCKNNYKQDFSFAGKKYFHGLSFDKDWISYSSDVKNQSEDTQIFVLYKDQQPQVTQNDLFVVGLQCKPVPVCN